MLKMLNWKRNSEDNKILGGAPATLIGTNTSIDINSLTGTESIRIDGSLKGNVTIKECFIVGETGSVFGNIKADDVIIAGKVDGDIISSGAIQIMTTAIINGDVTARSINIEEGATVHGRYNIGALEKEFEFMPVGRLVAQEN